jgi:hypothetical protein
MHRETEQRDNSDRNSGIISAAAAREQRRSSDRWVQGARGRCSDSSINGEKERTP